MNLTGEDIKKARLDQNLTQQEFAKKLGITRELLNKVETGKRAVSRSLELIFSNYLKGENRSHDGHTLNDPETNIYESLGKYAASPLAIKAVVEIAESNKVLAKAHDKQAEANREQAQANRELSEANKILAQNASKLIENVVKEKLLDVETRFQAILELLSEVAEGKKFLPQDLWARYSQIWDTLYKTNEHKNTQSEKDTSGR